MNHLQLYKSLCKTKVILFIALLYIPLGFFTLFFDLVLSCMITGFRYTGEFAHILQQPWLEVTAVALIQYAVLCFLFGLWLGFKQVISRNRDFFLS